MATIEHINRSTGEIAAFIEDLSISTRIGDSLENFSIDHPELLPEINSGSVSSRLKFQTEKYIQNGSYDLVSKFKLVDTQDIIDNNRAGAVPTDKVDRIRINWELKRRKNSGPRSLEKEETDGSTSGLTQTFNDEVLQEQKYLNEDSVRHRNDRLSNHLIALAAGVPALSYLIVDLEPILTDLLLTDEEKKVLIYNLYKAQVRIFRAIIDKFETSIGTSELYMFSKDVMEESIISAQPDAGSLGHSKISTENKESDRKSAIQYARVDNWFSDMIDRTILVDYENEADGAGTVSPNFGNIVGQMGTRGIAHLRTHKIRLENWDFKGVEGMKWTHEKAEDVILSKWYGTLFVKDAFTIATTTNIGIETQQIIDNVFTFTFSKNSSGKVIKTINYDKRVVIKPGMKLSPEAVDNSRKLAKKVLANYKKDKKLMKELGEHETATFINTIINAFKLDSKEQKEDKKLEKENSKAYDLADKSNKKVNSWAKKKDMKELIKILNDKKVDTKKIKNHSQAVSAIEDFYRKQ